MFRSVRFAVALAGGLATTHPVSADPLAATTPVHAHATAPATEQPAAQAPAWSSSPHASPGAGFGKNIVTVGFGWG
jgi:hypothetical protein